MRIQIPIVVERVAFPDPAVWYQRRPGGPWYEIGKQTAHRVKVCETCGQQFMARYRARFCSRSCQGGAQKSGAIASVRATGPRHGRWRGDSASYGAIHRRIYYVRGPASALACVDCGKRAQDWSRIHGRTGFQPDHYEPRCRPCHRDYDLSLLARGERHGGAKLSSAQVAEVRALWESEQIPGHRHRSGCGHAVQWTLAALASRFGVSRSAIHRLVHNLSWRTDW